MSTAPGVAAQLSVTQKRELLAQALRREAHKQVSEAPLSYGQKALWFLYRSAPDSAAYHVSFSARIRSAPDVAALQRAFQALVDRHGALRTVFISRDGEPRQRIAGRSDLRFEVVDCRDCTEAELYEKAAAAYREPFDLERAPPFKVNLFTRAAADHVLLITVHHIVYDAWSLWLNLEEIRQFYAADVAGAAAPRLPPPTVTYPQYIGRQQRDLDGGQGERLWDFWREALAGELSTLTLPTDRPRPPLQTYHGASLRFTVPPELVQRLRTLAQAEGVTPFMLMLAAYQVFLHRYSGQHDILVGSPTAGRSDPAVAGVTGYFVNPVVLRGNLTGNPAFTEFLQQVRETVVNALAHQDLPFPLLVERLQPRRDPSYAPLFQASFVYQKPQRSLGMSDWLGWSGAPGARMDWGGLEIEFFDLPQQEGQFDLELEVMETDRSFPCLFKYNTDLFDAPTIEQMSRHFQTLLHSIVATPRERAGHLPLLEAAERTRILRDSNATQVDYPQGLWVHQLFRRQAGLAPDAPALLYADRVLTYQMLHERINRLAHCLQSRGVTVGSVVGVCLERSIDMVAALHAVMSCGAAWLPLDPDYPAERLEYMAKDAGIALLLTHAALARRCSLASVPTIELDTERLRIARYPASDPEVAISGDDIAYVIYTSGSTGRPKGVAVPHRGLLNRLQWMQEQYRLDGSDRVLQKTPYSFDVSVWEFFWPLMTGATLIVAAPGDHRDSRRLVELITRHDITTLHFVPSMLRAFLEDEQAVGCRSLRRVFCSGEALPFDLQQRCFATLSADLHNLYGPTEASIDVSHWSCRRGSEDPVVPIGFPIANTALYILDAALNPTPTGVAGELHIGGVQLARGYLNQAELTAQKFIRDPFGDTEDGRLYKTGDLARYRRDGSIEYLGRLDQQVKIRGFRIEPGEIETVLMQCPEVKAAVVVAHTERGEQRLVAYFVGVDSESPQIAALRAFLSERLPDYMTPAVFVRMEELPLSSNGKVDRRALPAPGQNSREAGQSFMPPRDSVEQLLVREWQALLKISSVGVQDNFFELGGHSLLAVNLMARLEKLFGRRLPIATLFRRPTIEALGELLREQSAPVSASPLTPIQTNGAGPPLFCPAGGGGSVLYYYPLASCLGPRQPFYGLQAIGLDGQCEPLTRVEDQAAAYLSEIRKVQPQGPYRLAGHCFGGLVAFEMAQQLRRQGQDIDLLLLIDVPARRTDDGGSLLAADDAGWLIKLAGVIKESSGKDLQITRDALQGLSEQQRLEHFRQRMQSAGFLPPGAGVAHVRGLLRVFAANNTVRYEPQNVRPVPIVLFRAAEFHPDYDFTPADDPGAALSESSLGWQAYAQGKVAVHVVPGNHITMMSPPHVAQLAAGIALHLRERVELL